MSDLSLLQEERVKKCYERFYFDVLEGGEAFLEVDWNNYAAKEDLIRIGIKKETAIVRREDLETLFLALTKDPERYIRGGARKIGIKYVPVPQREYDKYKEWKKHDEKLKLKRSV